MCEQLRKHLAEAYEDELMTDQQQLLGTASRAGVAGIEIIAEALTHILFAMFRERGIYSHSTTMTSPAWRPDLAPNIEQELHRLISPMLVTFAACILEDLISEESSRQEVKQCSVRVLLRVGRPVQMLFPLLFVCWMVGWCA